ncbi:MAG TPA: glycosyltransferase family protein [Bacteroidota bacterium]|nr:glycosyltransferase family protein [Bacteroidota bacterium]
MKLLVVVQARTGSSRLPNKVMMPLAGKPLLERMIERVQAARTPFELVVATTTEAADDAVEELCRGLGTRVFRGHPTDLLDRHYHAARAEGADAVVKIPSDCPLIDPGVIDRVLAYYSANEGTLDYASNLHPASYPDGHDVEVMPLGALELAWQEATRPFEREHTTPFLWERPERFRIGNVLWESGRNLSMSHRWTIDYPEDYEFIRSVYDALWSPSRSVFSLDDILGLLESRPELAQINARYAGVNWYRQHADELKTVSRSEYRVIT